MLHTAGRWKDKVMKTKNRWGYVALGILILIFSGMVYAWSVMSAPIAAEFSQWTKGELSLTFTITMSGFCIGGFWGGLVSERLKAGTRIGIAAVFFLLAFFLSARTKGLWQLYIGFGILGGFASGLSYNAVIGTVLKWFPDHQGMVSGLLLMGFGIGSFLIGKVYAAVLSAGLADWRQLFQLLGIIVFVVLLMAGAFIQQPEKDFVAPAASAGNRKAGKTPTRDVKTTAMLKTSSFWFYAVWTILLGSSALALIAQASGIVLEVSPESSANTVATVVGMISVFNGVGRVLFGGLFDKLGYRKNMLLNNAMYLISVLVTILGLKTGSFPILIVSFICFGLSYGGVTPTNSAFILSFYGSRYYPVNFSVINMNLILSSFGGTLAGMIYDKQGSYLSIFVIMIAAVLLGTICTLLIRRPE